MPRFQDVLLTVGQLNYTWTNTESLWSGVMMWTPRPDGIGVPRCYDQP
ncbi:hypothetical protein CO731_03719 [Aminobacter sp. MSH1]|nr:hypothetical protein [Aminobacter sp. MSH1]AWC24238.1 hypothetical protein CO731_03719 [Aminobacter sp. MSH1]